MSALRFVPAGASALALLVMCVLGRPASAADLPEPYEAYEDTPAIVPMQNWAGFYAGGHLGGGWREGGQGFTVRGGNGGGGGGGGGDNNGGGDKDEIDGADGARGNDGGLGGLGGNQDAADKRRIGGKGGDGGDGGTVSSDGDDDGVLIGGLHLGYNWQQGNLVYGVEGDVSFDGGLDNYFGSLRARLGYARNDLLLYVTGGLAFRDGNGSDAFGLAASGGKGGKGGKNDDGEKDGDGEKGHAESKGGMGGLGGLGGDPTGTGYLGSDGGGETGIVLGAGVEYMLSSNVSAGFEGLWYGFGDDEDMTVLRARLTLHLNGAPHDSFKDGVISAGVANWSGFYVGGNAGAGFGNGQRIGSVKGDDGDDGDKGKRGAKGHPDLNRNGVPKTDGVDDPGGGGGGGGGGAAALVSLEDDGGALAGIHLGHNWQHGSYLIGLEGDADWADSSFRDYLATMRLRIGHTFDDVLVYGTAGVAFARGAGGVSSVAVGSGGKGKPGKAGIYENNKNYDEDAGRGGNPGLGGEVDIANSDGDDKVGFVVGGGFEVKLTSQTSLGLEGLYYGFEGGDGSSSGTVYEAGDDLSAAVIRGRLTFHLGQQDGALK